MSFYSTVYFDENAKYKKYYGDISFDSIVDLDNFINYCEVNSDDYHISYKNDKENLYRITYRLRVLNDFKNDYSYYRVEYDDWKTILFGVIGGYFVIASMVCICLLFSSKKANLAER